MTFPSGSCADETRTRIPGLRMAKALILIFIGGKMFLANHYTIPIEATLGVVVFILGGSVLVAALAGMSSPLRRQ